MFLLVIERQITYDDGYGHAGRPSMSTANVSEVKEMTEAQLKEWVLHNNNSYSKRNFKVYKAEEVKIKMSVSVDLDVK